MAFDVILEEKRKGAQQQSGESSASSFNTSERIHRPNPKFFLALTTSSLALDNNNIIAKRIHKNQTQAKNARRSSCQPQGNPNPRFTGRLVLITE